MAKDNSGFLPSNLKFRMTCVVVVLVLAASVLVTLVALVLAERDMRGVIGAQQSALLSTAAAFIDDTLESKQRTMAELAGALPAAALHDSVALRAFLASHPRLRTEFFNVTALDAKGDLVASLRPLRARPLSAVGRPYFEQTRAQRRGIISEPFISRLAKTPVVLVTEPVFGDKGELILMLTGGIDLQQSGFLRHIGTLRPGKTGYLFIMTSKGILLEHPDKSRLLEHINQRGGNRGSAMALAGFEGWVEAADSKGESGIDAYRRLTSTDWVVGAHYPTSEAFAPMTAMRKRAVLAAAMVAGVAGLVAWLAIYRLLAPLEALRSNIAHIRRGRAGIDVLKSTRDDEIGELGAAFHELMAEREAAQQRDLAARRAYEEQITASAKRARIIADSMPALIAYVDSEQRYQFTNAHYQDMLGIDPQSMIGKTISEMRGEHSYAEIADKATAALRGERQHFEYAAEEAGRPVHYMIDYIPDIADDGTVPGFYILASDISERKTIELVQAASERRLKLITDNLPALISYMDDERKFRFVNATFTTWFGVQPEALLARPLGKLIGRAAYAEIKLHLDRAFAGQAVTFEIKTALGGKARILETTCIPDLLADGSVAGIYSLTQDMTRMKEAEEKLMQLARSDALTGIANRRMFGEMLEQALERVRRHAMGLALAYLDIDHFKKINDSHGHAVGDEVLKEFACRLMDSVRATDTVARLSGDEFVIILDDIRGPHEAGALAAKVIDAVRQPFVTSAGVLRVTTSVGIALLDDDIVGRDSLLARADSALYAAKRQGRDRYTVHGQDEQGADGSGAPGHYTPAG